MCATARVQQLQAELAGRSKIGQPGGLTQVAEERSGSGNGRGLQGLGSSEAGQGAGVKAGDNGAEGEKQQQQRPEQVEARAAKAGAQGTGAAAAGLRGPVRPGAGCGAPYRWSVRFRRAEAGRSPDTGALYSMNAHVVVVATGMYYSPYVPFVQVGKEFAAAEERLQLGRRVG